MLVITAWGGGVGGEEMVFLLRHSTRQNGKVEAMRKKIAHFYQRNI